MKSSTSPVIVLDSGIGGLTVLDAIQKLSPSHHFIYIADHAFCPYGTKKLSEIRLRVMQLAQFAQKHDAQCLILACNTASVFAENLRRIFNFPIIDVITPTCMAVADITKNRKVALLATNATVQSEVYKSQLWAYGIQTEDYPCSDFVPLIEKHAANSAVQSVAERLLKSLPQSTADTVILGCTHFPLILNTIRTFATNKQIISCSQPTAQHVAKLNLQTARPQTEYFTTSRAFGNFSHLDIT